MSAALERAKWYEQMTTESVFLEWAKAPPSDRGVVRFRFQDQTGEEELFLKLLMPLLAEIGRRDNQAFGASVRPISGTIPFRPRWSCPAPLRVGGQQCTLGQWRAESEQSRFNLVRVQINLSIDERPGELLDAVGGASLGQFMSENFAW